MQLQVNTLKNTKQLQWSFNINRNIRVKLYDGGYQRLADLHNSLMVVKPNFYNHFEPTPKKRDAEYYKQRADEDGYTTFQMWCFMKDFGELTRPGITAYYSPEILINAEDITPNV